MMHQRNINTALLALMLLNVGCLAFLFFGKTEYPKIGVVNMDTLVYEFQGMKDATEQYSSKIKKWGTISDSLATAISKMEAEMREGGRKIKIEETRQKQSQLEALKKNFTAQRQEASEQAAQEDQNMTLSILNQLKSLVQDFAEQQGYEIILANHQSESVIYFSDAKDITKEMLAYANARYADK